MVAPDQPHNPARGAPLSIVHLNVFDEHGGAERLVSHLVEMQRAAGHKSVALVGHKTRADSHALAFDPDPDLARREEFRAAGLPDYEFRGSHRLVRHPVIQSADVIHAHVLYGGFFHPFSLLGLSQLRPFIWSIHDMQALTGYCSHALDCERWETGCGECPDLTRPGPALSFDNTAELWRDKKLIADHSRLWVVGASTWMVSQLQRSLLNRHPIHLIPNGIETALYRPADRRALRRKLGLPTDALIIGSLARTGILAHPWKGGSHARATLEALRADHPDLLFLDLGSSAPAPEPWIRSLCPNSPELMREALGALDFFLYPSIADTAPLSVVEAMACGLPVVGFKIGGLPDFVTENEGVLVPPNDTSSLIAAARRLASEADLRQRMGASARARAVEHFDRARMTEAYERLYREAIAACSPAGAPPIDAEKIEQSSWEELRTLQGKIFALEEKVEELRARRKKDETHIAELLRNRWLQWGMKFGVVRGKAKDWLRLKQREAARRKKN